LDGANARCPDEPTTDDGVVVDMPLDLAAHIIQAALTLVLSVSGAGAHLKKRCMARVVVANRFEAARLLLGTAFGAEANSSHAPVRHRTVFDH
jgi:hypothetical protein